MLELVTEAAPKVRPWKAPRKATRPGRPVTRRASLSAASTASAPEFPKKTVSSGSGQASASRAASRPTGSTYPRALQMWISLSAWSLIAAVTAGWWWPSEVVAMPQAKSRKPRPAESYRM